MADDHITVKLRQLSPYPSEQVLPEDGIYVLEQATGILRQANVSQLPFGSGGSGGGTMLSSPFKARFGDDNVTIVPDGSGGSNTIVSDVRLIGKSDYPVNSSQINNGVYRDDELIYDSVNGSVTIIGLTLNIGEVIVLYPQGVQGGSGVNLQSLLDRISDLEMMCAPLKTSQTGQPNGGRFLWMKPANEIPIGWAEDIDMRGRMPLGFDPSTQVDKPFYSVGGFFKSKITIDHMPAHHHEQGSESMFNLFGGGSFSGARNWGSTTGNNTYNKQYTSDVGGGQDFDFTNPYRIVYFIKYVGV